MQILNKSEHWTDSKRQFSPTVRSRMRWSESHQRLLSRKINLPRISFIM